MNERAGRAMPDRVLHLTRHFAHPRERVFAAWTDPSLVAAWWGPEGMSCPLCELDVRPGGAWATTMRSADGEEYHCSGVYQEVTPPARLVFTWAWHEDGVRGTETRVSVELHEQDGGTRLVLTHETFEDNEQRDLHGEGWTSAFDCLARSLQSASHAHP